MQPMLPVLPTFLAVYSLLYAAFGVQSPFLPELLREQGLRAEEIGIVLAASTAIRVLAGPAVGHVADRLQRHTLTLCTCALVAAVAGLGYVMIQGFAGLLLVALVQAAMLAPIVPLSDALATTAARRSETGEGRRFQYGWLRASGSAAFIVGTMLSGWAASRSGLASIVWVSGTLLAIGGAAALLLPKIPAAPSLSDYLARSTTRDWAFLLQIPAFRLLLIIAALVEGSHALHDAFSVIRWRAAGVGLPVISALWSESVLSEVLVFLLIGPRLVRMLGPGGAIALAAVAGEPTAPNPFFKGTTDAWYVPLVDIGFEGKGGKYLVLPPDYTSDVPEGYVGVRPRTYNTMTLLRSILASYSAADERAGDALVRQVKIYPLSKAANPPEQRLLDMTDILYNGLVKYDETFFTSLSRMLNEEPVQSRDFEMMGMLLPLGIERGKEFKSDAKMAAVLRAAAGEAHAWLMQKATTDYTPWWKDSQWGIPTPPITMPTAFKWETPNYFDVDSRAIALAQYFCPTAKLGTGSFYFATFHDHGGNPLEGGINYRLHVPADVPVREFWSVTVYSLKTSSFFLNSTRLTLGSLDKEMRKNADGTVDIYFGPKPPTGHTSNWLYTQSSEKWFPWFRVYGPEKAIFDKNWKLPDIEKIS